jgi:putative solute:sodium symporter small subunit
MKDGASRTPEHGSRAATYWRANFTLIVVLLVIWFLAAYAHPPFASQLNQIHVLTGFPLGYYLASQFSLVVFVVLIFAYALIMNKIIDPKYGFEDDRTE